MTNSDFLGELQSQFEASMLEKRRAEERIESKGQTGHGFHRQRDG